MEEVSDGFFYGLGSGELLHVRSIDGKIEPRKWNLENTSISQLRFLQCIPHVGLLIFGGTKTGGNALYILKYNGEKFEETITAIKEGFACPRNCRDLPFVSADSKYVAFFEGQDEAKRKLHLLKMESSISTKSIVEFEIKNLTILNARFHPQKDSLMYLLISEDPSKTNSEFLDRKQIRRVKIKEGCYVSDRIDVKEKVVDCNAVDLNLMLVKDVWKLLIVCRRVILFLDLDDDGDFPGKPLLVVSRPEKGYEFLSVFPSSTTSDAKFMCIRKNVKKLGFEALLFEQNDEYDS